MSALQRRPGKDLLNGSSFTHSRRKPTEKLLNALVLPKEQPLPTRFVFHTRFSYNTYSFRLFR